MKNKVIDFKMNWRSFWVMLVTFLLCSTFAFVRIASENTIGRVSLSGYQVGQIASEDIISTMDLKPTVDNPLSVNRGDCIVMKGYPITPEQYDTLMRIADSPSSTDFASLVKALLFLLLLSILFYFTFSKPVLGRDVPLQEIMFCAIGLVATYALCSLCVGLGNMNPTSTLLLVMPTSLMVLLASLIYGNATGLVLGIILALGVWESCGFSNILLGFVLGSSLMSARLVKSVKTRNGLVTVSVILVVFNVLLILLLELIFGFGNKIDENATRVGSILMNVQNFLTAPFFVGVNGFLSGMLCLGLLTPLELMLNTTSPFRLKDLADMDNDIFHDMQKNAVGTYNHSLSVASMARSACEAIGANAQLAYVGAIYHDIGKLDNPEYFTENQSNGVNPHDNLEPIVSAGYLENHVIRGVERAREMNLPKKVIDIIAQHHGNSVKGFFMSKELETNKKLPLAQQRSEEEIKNEYRYKAEKSSSKESMVVQLADSIEAASVSNKDKLLTSEAREELIDKIVKAKISDGQLTQSGVTYGDIEIIKASFLKDLNDKNYSRIKYQNDSEKKSPEETPVTATVSTAETKVAEKTETKKSTKSSIDMELKEKTESPSEETMTTKKPRKSATKDEEKAVEKTKRTKKSTKTKDE